LFFFFSSFPLIQPHVDAATFRQTTPHCQEGPAHLGP
jgi:hypothetical protein